MRDEITAKLIRLHIVLGIFAYFVPQTQNEFVQTSAEVLNGRRIALAELFRSFVVISINDDAFVIEGPIRFLEREQVLSRDKDIIVIMIAHSANERRFVEEFLYLTGPDG